jgi:hypothetical protein
VLTELDRVAPDGVEAALLRASWRSARGDRRGAIKVLRAAAGRHPGGVSLRLALVGELMREGLDRAGALSALWEVLAVDPGNVEAKRLSELIARRWT